MWQSGTAPPRRDIWVLGGGVTDGSTEAREPAPSRRLAPGLGSLGPGTGLLPWPLLPPRATGLVESWNVRFRDSEEGLALPFQGKVYKVWAADSKAEMKMPNCSLLHTEMGGTQTQGLTFIITRKKVNQ